MKLKLFRVALILLPFFSMAQQFSITGSVKSEKESLAYATISIANTSLSTLTKSDGSFEFKNLKAGKYILTASFLGYENLSMPVDLSTDIKSIAFVLKEKEFYNEEILVLSTRLDEKLDISQNKIKKADFEKNNLGQDLPYLLNSIPSLTINSDAGAGIGYTGYRLRGSDASRINVSLNGIPLNDAESQGSFFINLPDFASSIENIQVQRGVGSSTNGAGAFAGSINVQTTTLKQKAYAEINNSAGSFSSFKNTVQFGSGLINNRFTFDGRLSKINSNGFIDRANSDLKSYFLSASYYGKKTVLKLNTFSGTEKTYQAWNGIPEAKLRGSAQDIQDYISRNGLDKEDSTNIVDSKPRTYNMFTYSNQTDNYQQDHYQALFSHEINSKLNFNVALHGTIGKGYYEEYKKNAKLSSYNIDPVIIGTDTITESNLIRRKWLDNHFYGYTYSVNYKFNNSISATLGGAANQYNGKHFGEVIWAQYASNSEIRHRYYDNDARKRDINEFVKFNFSLSKKLIAFTDFQFRHINYSFFGVENKQVTAKLNFFNPKLGLSYFIDPNNKLTGFYGIGNKEPNRDDFVQSTLSSRPKHETLNDLELGYEFKYANGIFKASFFNMMYKNQLVLTGKVNDVGAYTRTNVDESYRRGIELESFYKINNTFSWNANLALSQNKIKNFVEYIDDYDAGGQIENKYTLSDIAYSPAVIAFSGLNVNVFKQASISLNTKYTGKQYLDNTQNESRKLNSFLTNDVRFSYSKSIKNIGELSLNLMVNNILDKKYEANGYTYSYLYSGQVTTENFYYPQAGRNILAGINLKF